MDIVPLFTTKFSQGRKTYFFVVKKAKDGKAFLKSTCSQIRGEVKVHSYMTVTADEIIDFRQAIAEASLFILNQ